MKNKPGDRCLDSWWSSAIKKKYGGRCAICNGHGVHAHHIIKRRYKVTRWLVINGICLCLDCHRDVESGLLAREIRLSEADKASLSLWSQYNLKDWCQKNGMTTNEFRADRLRELKRYIGQSINMEGFGDKEGE